MRSKQLSRTCMLLGLFACLSISMITGCGGSSGSTGGGPDIKITGVTVTSCTPANTTPGGTSACSASVQGTGGVINQAVTWSVAAPNGSISTTGIYTASASINASTKVTITATSVADPNVTGTFTVTVAPATPTVTSVAVNPPTASTTPNGTVAMTSTSTGQNNPSQGVTVTVSPATAGQVGAVTTNATGSSWTFTAAATSVTAPVTATVTACSTVSGSTTTCGTSTITINPPTPTVTSVTASCTPTTIAAGETSACSANVLLSDGTVTHAVTWSVLAANGTISSSGAFDASTSISATTQVVVTATSVADPSKSGTFTVTVTPEPLPALASFSQTVIALDDYPMFVYGLVATGTGFTSSTTLYCNNCSNLYVGTVASPTQIDFSMQYVSHTWSPGPDTMAACSKNGDPTTCGPFTSIDFFGARNYLVASPSGEFFGLDNAQNAASGNGIVRKWTSAGVSETGFSAWVARCIAHDTVMPIVILDGIALNEDGTDSQITPIDGSGNPFFSGSQATVQGCDAENSFVGFAQPSTNSLGSYDASGGKNSRPVVHMAALGNHPEEVVTKTFGGTTYHIGLGVDPNPSLYKVRASDAFVVGPALALTGVTSQSAVKAANATDGSWALKALDNGTIAVLATHNRLLVLINQSTWAIVKSVPLTMTGVPMRVIPDETSNAFIVAYAAPGGTGTTTYSSVDASSGVETQIMDPNDPSKPLTSTVTGVGGWTNGTVIASYMRNQLQLLHK